MGSAAWSKRPSNTGWVEDGGVGRRTPSNPRTAVEGVRVGSKKPQHQPRQPRQTRQPRHTPAKPRNPANPGTPGNPVKPVKPANPANPANTVTPVNPANPVNPVNPIRRVVNPNRESPASTPSAPWSTPTASRPRHPLARQGVRAAYCQIGRAPRQLTHRPRCAG